MDMIQDSIHALYQMEPGYTVLIGSYPGFYTGKNNYCQRLGMAFPMPRPERLERLSRAVGHPITSMKQLTIGEAVILLRFKELVCSMTL